VVSGLIEHEIGRRFSVQKCKCKRLLDAKQDASIGTGVCYSTTAVFYNSALCIKRFTNAKFEVRTRKTDASVSGPSEGACSIQSHQGAVPIGTERAPWVIKSGRVPPTWRQQL
jgi:hypothetical protein